jgi:hypothetical protein
MFDIEFALAFTNIAFFLRISSNLKHIGSRHGKIFKGNNKMDEAISYLSE